MTETAFSFAVVAEARADKQIASELAERVLVDEVDWIEREGLPALVRWQGLDESAEYLSWAGIGNQFKARGMVSHGRFRSVPGTLDERRARKALLLFTSLPEPPDSVFLVRDTDAEEGRVESLAREREAGSWKFPVLLATPHPKRECWVLAGFDPADAGERAALDEVRSHLGFDPCLKAERLTAKRDKGKRNAKKVLAELMPPGSEREECCWRDTALSVLGERGQESRLAAYLAEVTDRLVPLFAGSAPRT